MIPNPFPGKFIVFEGIDGCGKSTQANRTYDWLYRELRKTVILTKEPNRNGEWGSKIYVELNKPGGLHKTDPHGFQTWYACDSKINLREVIIPHLRAGCIVLSDRYRPSMCYGTHNPHNIPVLIEMNQQIIGEDFIWPNTILIFDVSAETAIARLKKKGSKLDEHERLEVLKRVRQNYLHFANIYKNCHFIDGEPSEDVVSEEAKNLIKQTLNSE